MYYNLAARRLDYLLEKERQTLYAIRIGYDGEADNLAIFLRHMPKTWRILTDLYYIYEGKRIQIDALLITACSLIILEVKNLKAYYSYENGDWIRNGQRLKQCYFDQLKRTNDIFRNVMATRNHHINTQRKLILINEDKTVTFNSNENQRYVLERSEIKKFIDELVELEKGQQEAWVVDEMSQIILKSQTIPAKAEYIELNNRNFNKGFMCVNDNCSSNQLSSTSRYQLICKKCGHIEPKSKAIQRTICEYSILFPNHKPTAKEIRAFIATDSLNKTINRVLFENFKSELDGKVRRYQLPATLFEYAFPKAEYRYYEHAMLNGCLVRI